MASFQFVHEGRWVPRSPGEFGVDVSAASGLTVPSDSQAAAIQASGGAVRYRDDGTSPDGSTGMVIADGESIFYTGDLSAIEFMEDNASGGVLNVLYYAWED